MKRHLHVTYPVAVFITLLLCLVCNAQSLIDATHEATCRVRAGGSVGTGTCFLIGENGDAFFLTNHHVAGKTGSNVRVELWRAGVLQPAAPGRVVLAQINSGYVDGAVIRIAAGDLAKFSQQKYVPISLPSDPKPDYKTLISRGCPGGTWQTQFVGSVIDQTNQVIKFHPRPGGGRSGSSMIDPLTGEIVALIAWSSGKPNHEAHGTDGIAPSSGHGIAMNRDVIWSILQNKAAAAETQRPADEVPLLFISETADCEQQQFSPEDYEAFLRRLRDRDREQLPPIQRPRLLPQKPILPMMFWMFVRLIAFVAFILVVAFLGYRYGKKWLQLVLLIATGIAVTSLSASDCHAQDDYQSAMRGLAERWSADAVTDPTVWMSPEDAMAKSMETGSPLLILMTTERCAPCLKFKRELNRLAEESYLNHSYLTQLSAQDSSHQKLAKQLLPAAEQANTGYPVLLLYTHQITDNGTRKWTLRVVRGWGFADSDANATELKPTLKKFLADCGVR